MHKEEFRQDPRTARTSNAIRQALIELIPLNGYGKITIKDITQQAELNWSAFHLHFQNKEDLLTSGFEEVWESLVHALPPCETGESGVSASLTRAALTAEFQELEESRPFYQALLGKDGPCHFKKRLQEHVLARLRELLAGSPEPLAAGKVPQQAALALLSGSCLSLLDWWLIAGSFCSPENMFELFIWLFSLQPCDLIGFELEPDQGHFKHPEPSGGSYGRDF